MTHELETSLGYHFSDPSLLQLALTHPSRKQHSGGDYQRLEFLGDAVLGMAITELLYHQFPKEAEGELARRKAQLVSSAMLIAIAESIHLDDAIISDDVVQQDDRSVKYLEDVCEALVGAVFLDGGWEAAQTMVQHLWKPRLHQQITPPKDPKTALQEWAQGRGLPLPDYQVVSHDGPAHQPHFVVSVTVQEHGTATGEGTSKRTASSAAAKALLEQLET